MREIKFRGWSNGEMVYSTTMPDFSFWKWASYDNNTILMQYTGLKDKNGKEIYEGDVVRHHFSPGREHIFVLSPVENFIELWLQLRTRRYGEVFKPKLVDLAEYLEVIGNIYQNPELLHETR